MYDALIGGTDNPSISVDCRRITNKFCCTSLHDVWRLCQRYLTIPSKIVCRISTGVSCDGSRPSHNHWLVNALQENIWIGYFQVAEVDSSCHQADSHTILQALR